MFLNKKHPAVHGMPGCTAFVAFVQGGARRRRLRLRRRRRLCAGCPQHNIKS